MNLKLISSMIGFIGLSFLLLWPHYEQNTHDKKDIYCPHTIIKRLPPDSWENVLDQISINDYSEFCEELTPDLTLDNTLNKIFNYKPTKTCCLGWEF